MAPAPKSRVPKGEVVDSSGKTTLGGGGSGDIHSTDVEDDKDTQRDIGTIVGDISKENQHERDKSPRIAPNLRRISSSIAGSDRERLLKRSNTAEMREHLKHLGPSNLASRPRQTRYNTVKIKPGSDAASGDRSRKQDGLPKSASKSKSNDLLSPADAQNGVHDGLISAGAKEAQDGALAVLQGYGTITPTPTNPGKPPRSPPDERPSSKASNGSGKEAQSPAQRPLVKRNTSHNTLGSQNDGSTSRPGTPKIKKSLTISVARSGYITKNIVEAGGTQKMVLEQSSSSEELAEQPGGRSSDNNTGESDDKAPEDGTVTGGDTSTSNRKKRRRRKRKGGPQSKIVEGEGEGGGEEEEEQPFLQGGNKG